MKTILVADDEDYIRLLVTQTLDEHRVLEARSGREAISAAHDRKPNLILLDWMMPGMDGLEVLRALRQDEATRDIPVVMVTGRVSKADQKQALADGASACLSKPFTPRNLRACVEEVLGAA